ncbi:MAG: MFS transporter [Trueperaceae bacterium]|nr:MAG: MFS transporter [Trueperaceae bacterium]
MRHLATFYLIVLTQTTSLIGSRMTAIALGIWLFDTTGDTAPLLLMVFFAELPGAVAGSVAGVLIDRLDRRVVLLLADGGQAVTTTLLLLIFLAGDVHLWQLYLLALVQGTFATFQQPALEATTTVLVPERQRERANAVQQMAFPLAGVIAPALTGLVYAWIGITGVIIVDLATFTLAVSLLSMLHIPRPKATAEGTAARGHILQELLAGVRFLIRRRVLFGLVLYMMLINFLLNGPLELAIPYLVTVTGSEAVMGGLMSLMSLGALVGAGLIAVWGGSRPRLLTLLPGLLLSGVMFLVYGTAREPLGLGISLFLLTIPLPISFALYLSILQVKTPPDMQGRIFAMVSQLGFLGATLSFLLTGQIVDRVLEPAVGTTWWKIVAPVVGQAEGAGMRLLLVATGVVILVATTAMLATPAVRRLESDLPDYKVVTEN